VPVDASGPVVVPAPIGGPVPATDLPVAHAQPATSASEGPAAPATPSAAPPVYGGPAGSGLALQAQLHNDGASTPPDTVARPKWRSETFLGLRAALVPTAVYNSEICPASGKGCAEGIVFYGPSFGFGLFVERRVHRYVAIGGQFDYLALSPKNTSSQLHMLSLGPSVRLALPFANNTREAYIRASPGLSIDILPTSITESSVPAGQARLSSTAFGWFAQIGGGLMVRQGRLGLFLEPAISYSEVYSDGSVAGAPSTSESGHVDSFLFLLNLGGVLTF
jgi:hypothetical protein